MNAAPEPGAWYIEYLSFGPMPDDLNARYFELAARTSVEAVFPLHYGAKNRTLVVFHAPRLGGPAPRRETAQSPESVQSRLTGARRSRIRAISSGCSERHFSFFGADPPVLCFFSFARSITAADEGDSRSSQKSMILR